MNKRVEFTVFLQNTIILLSRGVYAAIRQILEQKMRDAALSLGVAILTGGMSRRMGADKAWSLLLDVSDDLAEGDGRAFSNLNTPDALAAAQTKR